MRKDIHPDYVECTVHCSCGNSFKTHSTKPELHVELCNECHPFYTGQQKFVDTGGRVQRFTDKISGANAAAVAEREAARKAERQASAMKAQEAAKAAREAKAAEKAARAAKYAEKAAKAAETAEAEAVMADSSAEQASDAAAETAPEAAVEAAKPEESAAE